MNRHCSGKLAFQILMIVIVVPSDRTTFASATCVAVATEVMKPLLRARTRHSSNAHNERRKQIQHFAQAPHTTNEALLKSILDKTKSLVKTQTKHLGRGKDVKFLCRKTLDPKP